MYIKSVSWLLLGMLCLFRSAFAQETMLDKALTNEERSIAKIGALAGKGDLEGLAFALAEGLDAGLTVNQLKELLIHVYAYAGFPRSLRGLQTFMTVLEQRKAQGIVDLLGNDNTARSDTATRYARGKEVLQRLTGNVEPEVKAGYAAFAPAIEVFLKEHLFADLFERDVLNDRQRELTTVAVLCAVGDVEPMLQSHLRICLHIGLQPKQLQELMNIMKDTLGEKEGGAAEQVWLGLLQTENK